MNIKGAMFNRDDLPDHLNHEVSEYVNAIFVAIAPRIKDKNSLNFAMAALNWVSFLVIKEFIADHHQQNAVLGQAKAILKNLEEFKHRDFMKAAKEKWEKEQRG